jgi:hypothetical protein
MIISGGFNIYPSDLEAVLAAHPDVAEAAVAGVPSDQWGETPVGFVVLKAGAAAGPEQIRAWANSKLGKTQRLSDLLAVDSIPRSHIGKVAKRDLRDLYSGAAKSDRLAAHSSIGRRAHWPQAAKPGRYGRIRGGKGVSKKPRKSFVTKNRLVLGASPVLKSHSGLDACWNGVGHTGRDLCLKAGISAAGRRWP